MKRLGGFTLIEIMIALLLGVIVVGTVGTIYIATVQGSSDTVKASRLNHDLDMAMQLMINDIRRAGFWGGAIAGSVATKNPFTYVDTVSPLRSTNIQIPSSSCILYSYDEDDFGTADYGNDDLNDEDHDNNDDTTGAAVPNSNDFFGFKLDGTTIRMRLTGTNTDDCTDGSWGSGELIDGDEIEITGLTFSFNPLTGLPASTQCLNVTANQPCSSGVSSGDMTVTIRQVNIILTGRLKDDPTISKTVTGTVRVRNDRLYKEP